MDQIGFESIVISLAEKMRSKGSWCGETHLQKAMYFLQELMQVPTELDFILYKHGPFSFDLQPRINTMLADNILSLQVKDPMYGPTLVNGQNVDVVQNQSQSAIQQYETKIAFIAEKLGKKNVAELERVGTALLVILRDQPSNDDDAAKKINELKPHVSLQEALAAVKEVRQIIYDAQPLLN